MLPDQLAWHAIFVYVHLRYLDRAADFGLKQYEGAEKFGGRTRTFVIRTTGSPEERGAENKLKRFSRSGLRVT